MRHLRLLLILSSAVLAGVYAHQRWSGAEARQSFSPLPQPQEWVAFSADLEISSPDGTRYAGRYCRSADGSHRTTLQDGAGNVSVTIRDIGRKVAYVGVGNEWTARAVDLGPEGHRPMQWHLGMKGLTLYRFKLDLKSGGSGSLRATNGFAAYHYTTPSGGSWLVVPELNFQPVVRLLVDGRRWAMSNIELGDPPPTSFQPPAGARIKWIARPAGSSGDPVGQVRSTRPGRVKP